MVHMFKELIKAQFEAALSTLGACIDKCPADKWDAPVANLAFCQAAFHALFYTDCYLSENTDALLSQQFHRDNTAFFRDYEEMEDREQKLLYDKASINAYVQHCRRKVAEVIAAETAESLGARCGFDWLPISRTELHVYNIRHIQHHAAQLILRLRLDTDINIPWARSGWRED